MNRDRDQVLQQIRNRYQEQGFGLGLEELRHLVSYPRSRLAVLVNDLQRIGAVVRTKDARLEPAPGLGGPMITRQLTAEETERLRRGEPSCGAPTTCVGLPEAVVRLGQLPKPPHPHVDAPAATKPAAGAERPRRGRPRSFTDEQLLTALSSCQTHQAAAQPLRVTPSTITRHAKGLDLPTHRRIAPQGIPSLEAVASTPRRGGAPKKVSDQCLVAVLESTGFRQSAGEGATGGQCPPGRRLMASAGEERACPLRAS